MIEVFYKVTCAWCGATETDTHDKLIDNGWRTISSVPGSFGKDFEYAHGGLDVICKNCVSSIQPKIDSVTEAQNNLIQAQVSKFNDDDALSYSSLFPLWDNNHTYAVGDRVRYNNILYKCINSHTSQDSWTPDVSPSLWTKVLPTSIPGSDNIPEWVQPDSTNPYAKGDRVRHYSQVWESLVDNNVWEPGVSGTESLWQAITASS